MMCGYLQMVDIYVLPTGKYKLLLLCLPVEISSNHLKVARCVRFLSSAATSLSSRRAAADGHAALEDRWYDTNIDLVQTTFDDNKLSLNACRNTTTKCSLISRRTI